MEPKRKFYVIPAEGQGEVIINPGQINYLKKFEGQTVVYMHDGTKFTVKMDAKDFMASIDVEVSS